MFHVSLIDAVSYILRVHGKSKKYGVSFSQGSLSTLFRLGEHVFHICLTIFSIFTTVQNYKNRTYFSRVIITNVQPRLLWFTVDMHFCFCLSVVEYLIVRIEINRNVDNYSCKALASTCDRDEVTYYKVQWTAEKCAS